MPQASLLLDSNEPAANIAYQADTLRTPASTLKILTAWLAIQHWGLAHRFHTDIYLNAEQALWIKGYGDPLLVSEEIERIASQLAASGLQYVADLYTDESYFQQAIRIDGQSRSDNPYDAPPAPLAANFNTIHIVKNQRGIQSAEQQTPLTDTARRLARSLPRGKHRINIGDQHAAARYFAELLRAKLREHGVKVEGGIRSAKVPPALTLHYRHHNSQPLENILRSMLRYSTNFTANQLFLMLGAEQLGAPASMQKSRHSALQKIAATFHWPGFDLYEGAGLSRRNRISAGQMIELLHAFQSWKQLLNSDRQGIKAKSGTLTGISSYAGYLEKNGSSQPFALFIEQKVPFNFRLEVAENLLDDSGKIPFHK